MKYILQDNNSNYVDRVKRIIEENKKDIFNFFDMKEKDLSFTIYIYSSIKDLVDGLKNRGFNKDPDYMCACFKDEDNSLNLFEPKDKPSSDEWSKDAYDDVIFHELVHAIQFNIFGTTPEWLNEGIAKYLDGSFIGCEKILSDIISDGVIPEQNEIENEFGLHDYDSYIYAYLMVSYFIDYYGKDKLIEVLRDIKELDKYKDNLLNRAVDYYRKDCIDSYVKKGLSK